MFSLQLFTDGYLSIDSNDGKPLPTYGNSPYRMKKNLLVFLHMNFNVTVESQGSIGYYESTDKTSNIVKFGNSEISRFLGKEFNTNHVFVVNYVDVEETRSRAKVCFTENRS